MDRPVSEFNGEGIAAFHELIKSERAKVKPSQPARVSGDFLSAVARVSSTDALVRELSSSHRLDDSLEFDTRYDFGKYLNEALPDNVSKVQYSNVGLWAWISAVYLPQLLKPSRGNSSRELWSAYRYIPLAYSKFRYYRHLAFISFWLHRQLGDNAARLFLSRPMY